MGGGGAVYRSLSCRWEMLMCLRGPVPLTKTEDMYEWYECNVLLVIHARFVALKTLRLKLCVGEFAVLNKGTVSKHKYHSPL